MELRQFSPVCPLIHEVVNCKSPTPRKSLHHYRSSQSRFSRIVVIVVTLLPLRVVYRRYRRGRRVPSPFHPTTTSKHLRSLLVTGLETRCGRKRNSRDRENCHNIGNFRTITQSETNLRILIKTKGLTHDFLCLQWMLWLFYRQLDRLEIVDVDKIDRCIMTFFRLFPIVL